MYNMIDILKIFHKQKEIGQIILNAEKGEFELRYIPEVAVVYISDDLPALTMYGKKFWNEWKYVKRFGNEKCMISEKKVNIIIREIIDIVDDSLKEIDYYCKRYKRFKIFGDKMKKFIINSLENLKKEV
jgi:hypothetical protein